MEEMKKRLVHIHSARGIGWKSIYRFIHFDSTLQLIFTLKEHQFPALFQMTAKNAKLFYADLHSTSTDALLDQFHKEQVHLLTIFDNEYPACLSKIYDPPWVLYLKGKKSLLKSNCISVVGTRNPSPYGIDVIKTIIPPLIKNNWTIVSGLALGIDAEAHKISIKEKGNTIAVLGSGVHQIYPTSNQSLASEMAISQLLLSEFPPYRKAEKWHFPLRNRIISGISKGTVIIEAKERSGSLITAEQALEQGRDVFAVPGSIFEPRSHGTNRLIQQGAKLVLTAEDIIEEI
ncbi:DNA-processing protein DprA [Schinkia azotoformans]|uniref:Rossmann fold nucleotide-binding protein involved in DNA uptake n=1 Tax=Schinkia azotoformans LMG 9581 TaxID=1131731 RepID=K6DSW2_SCHAZ|nr:DNA-processing protein DprA [Schinkia azotoformans]EKN63871.1 Rossmann fold nucleotide-binding protein involved in DNA uptake [Schinkia azotoformans LMG 9581]MEC1638265.1 DNA-processing protein DprA [Schinkia azotoformans]MEC1721847.1 DNA-processing protein DprA [Schinkia azotoformans]MEC1946301.1 DNA-processing protein DprA [Schinkia azotoformans]MED4351851.1 DNA-processing protein DprA [Schinkia azotoformans]